MKQMRIILLLIVLLGSSLACNLGSRLGNSSDESIVVSPQAAENLVEKVQEAENAARSGEEVELVVTESEVTSLIMLELNKQPSTPIDDIQVYLRDGYVKVTGVYSDSGFNFPIEIIAEPGVTDSGNLQVKLISAKIGPVSAPDGLREQAQELIDRSVAEIMTEQSGGNFIVTYVDIADGNLTIRGHYL